MKLVLIRHATRNTHAAGDASLNPTGMTQADELLRLLKPQGPLPVPSHLVTSPKKRAKQTLTPLSVATHAQLLIDSRLDERKQNESMSDFTERVTEVLNHLSQRGEAPTNPALENQSGKDSPREISIYLCTHLDWLELALNLLDSDLSDFERATSFAPCEFKIFKWQSNSWIYNGGGVATGRNPD
jgi:phosphohistidine phosphatase SixA